MSNFRSNIFLECCVNAMSYAFIWSKVTSNYKKGSDFKNIFFSIFR